MIEKKISYEINIEKPSKTKPVKQGGVLNYLGKQKTVNAPVKWRSSKDHPIAHLSYITKDEEKILIDLNLYGSLKGKPNKGPFGLPSLQGSGGGSGGDGGGGDGGSSGGDSSGDSGEGDSGPGGSDDGSGHGGPGPGATGDDSGSMGGIGMGDVGGLGVSDTSGMSVGDVAGTSEDAGMGGVAGNAVGAAATAAAAEANTGINAAVNAVQNALTQAVQNAINNPVSTMVGMAFGPVAGLAARGIAAAVDAANRGVTGPSDDTQETSSVQSGPAQSPGGEGGITTLPQYAPLYNQATGDPLLDSLIARYRANISPSSFGV